MIREVTTKDVEGIVDLESTKLEEQFDRTYFKKVVKKMIMQSKFQIFVYEQNNKIAGYIIGALSTTLFNSRLHGTLVAEYLHPSVSNQFIEGDLKGSLKAWFRENGCAHISQVENKILEEIE